LYGKTAKMEPVWIFFENFIGLWFMVFNATFNNFPVISEMIVIMAPCSIPVDFLYHSCFLS